MPDNFRDHVRPEAPTGALVDLDDYELEITRFGVCCFVAMMELDKEDCACKGDERCPECHGRGEMLKRANDLLKRLPR